MDTKSEKFAQAKDIGLKALAVVGVVAILAVATWGSVQAIRLAPGAGSAVGSAFTAAVTNFNARFISNEELALTVQEQTVNAGEAFVLFWEHVGRNSDGTYVFSYECRDGLSFESPDSTGESMTVLCDTPFNFLDAQDSLVLTAVSRNNRFLDVPVSLGFIPNGDDDPSVAASLFLTVINEDVTDSSSTLGSGNGIGDGGGSNAGSGGSGAITPGTRTEQTTTIPGSGSATGVSGGGIPSDPNGFIDLEVKILETGVINKTTNVFTATDTVKRGSERAAIRFIVTNVGTKTSGEWNFAVDLPTIKFYVFRPSDAQRSLNPGERIEYTLGFDELADQDDVQIVVNVDTTRSLVESTRDNNSALTTLSVDRD